MVETLFIDADGVAMNSAAKFSDKLAEEYDISTKRTIDFFSGPFDACRVGEADLKETLMPYLDGWGWKDTPESFFDLWFSGDSPNMPLIDLITELREHEVKVYLVSQQEKYRAAYIHDEVKLDQYFDGTFFTCDEGYLKTDSKFYESVLGKLAITAESVAFFDDKEMYLSAARQTGITGYFYTGVDDFKKNTAYLLQ